MKIFLPYCVIAVLSTISLHAQNVGVGTDSPVEFFSVGASSQFRVNASGNLVRINNVQYSFPAVQATSGSVLANDGSGNLSWTKVTTGNISATGTASNTTFLRGDGSWAAPAGGESVSTPVNATFTGLTASTTAFGSSGANQVYSITIVTSGTYMVVVNTSVIGSSNDCISSFIYLLQNGTEIAHGNGVCAVNGFTAANIVRLVAIQPGDVISIRATEFNATRTINGNISFTRLY